MFKRLFNKKSAPNPQSAKPGSKVGSVVGRAHIFEKNKLSIVAGLRWTPLTKGEKGKLFNEARVLGDRSYCMTPEGSQIGFFSSNPNGLSKGHGKLVSLALLLIKNYSQGGKEIFAFHVDAERSCLVALRDGQPVPGFDVIGSVDMVTERRDTFLQLADVGSVRRFGATDLLGNAEEINWDLLLDEANSKVRLKKIPDIRKIFFALAVATVLLMTIFGAIAYKLVQDKKNADEQARIASDPNILYETKIDGDLAAVTGLGQASLERMVGGLKQVPLQIKGWRLSKVECSPALCNASWIRTYGNFSEFEQALPPSAMGQPQYDIFKPDSLDSAILVTQHRLESAGVSNADSPAQPPHLIRSALPLSRAVPSKFFSTLQDLTMVDIKVKVEPAQLFAGQGDVNQLVRPVVNAVWTIEGPLWTLDDIVLEDYTSLDTLTIDLDVDKTASSMEKIRYKLAGKYYAKGKDF